MYALSLSPSGLARGANVVPCGSASYLITDTSLLSNDTHTAVLALRAPAHPLSCVAAFGRGTRRTDDSIFQGRHRVELLQCQRDGVILLFNPVSVSDLYSFLPLLPHRHLRNTWANFDSQLSRESVLNPPPPPHPPPIFARTACPTISNGAGLVNCTDNTGSQATPSFTCDTGYKLVSGANGDYCQGKVITFVVVCSLAPLLYSQYS